METKNFATLTSEQAQEIDGGRIRLISIGPIMPIMPILPSLIIKLFF